MNKLEYMRAVIDECDIHASRLRHSFEYLSPLFPITTEMLSNFNWENPIKIH